MKERKSSPANGRIPVAVLLPIEDHRIYSEALRILRLLMGRRAPTIEALIVYDLHGRDSEGVVDNYLDGIAWPLDKGRAVTIRLRERDRQDGVSTRRGARKTTRLLRSVADPARN